MLKRNSREGLGVRGKGFRIRRALYALPLTLLLCSCSGADKMLGSTEASYGDLHYKSNKNQETLKAKASKNADGTFAFEIETTATTPEAAMAYTAQMNLQAWKLVSALVDKLMAGAQSGALAGS